MSTALARKNRHTFIALMIVFLAMLVLSFASVPLYRIFCQRTGYGGTPQIVYSGTDRRSERLVTVQFNADVHRDVPWKFVPLQREVTVVAGETGLAFYRVTNKTDEAITGIAVYNVTPDKAGIHFNKIACFCFEEQIIYPHQTVDLPVQFYIDPDIADDPNLKDVHTITLSYTFFHAKDPNLPDILGLPSVGRRH